MSKKLPRISFTFLGNKTAIAEHEQRLFFKELKFFKFLLLYELLINIVK